MRTPAFKDLLHLRLFSVALTILACQQFALGQTDFASLDAGELAIRHDSAMAKLTACELRLTITRGDGVRQEKRLVLYQNGVERESKARYSNRSPLPTLEELLVVGDKITRVRNYDYLNPQKLSLDPSKSSSIASGDIYRGDPKNILRLSFWQMLRSFRVAANADAYSLSELVAASIQPATVTEVVYEGRNVLRLTAFPPPTIGPDGSALFDNAKIEIDLNPSQDFNAVRVASTLDLDQPNELIVFEVSEMQRSGDVFIPKRVIAGGDDLKAKRSYDVKISVASCNKLISRAKMSLNFPENLTVFEQLAPGRREVIQLMGRNNVPALTFDTAYEFILWREKTFGIYPKTD